VQERHALAHPDQPEAVVRGARVKAAAVVLHADANVAVVRGDGDVHALGVGVADGVAHGFLHDPVDRRLEFGELP